MNPLNNKNNNGSNKGKGSDKVPDNGSQPKIPPEVKAARDALRGKPSSPQKNKESTNSQGDIFPLSRAHREAAKKPVIGKFCPGKGIYLGQWTPAGQVSKTFNLFAAPENLPNKMGFNKASITTRALVKWHGYNGLDQFQVGKNEEEVLLESLASGSYKGEWFIPPVSLLKSYLMKQRRQEDLAKSLGPDKQIDLWFHSCSRSTYVEQYLVSLNLLSGQEASYNRWEHDANVRLMRAEPV